jgi:hypothetical protein
MVTLLDVIKYDHKHYSELMDSIGKREIEGLAIKLKPLENEIVNHKAGSITIMKSGNIFTDSYPTELADRITNILVGRQ